MAPFVGLQTNTNTMEILFLGVIIFLLVLAVFDLAVGVGNDAVNFMNSAIGTKAAPYKRILIIAAIGIFIGAAMSNGMMDVARHGIFNPQFFSFYDVVCIFMAVMVANVILLDIFNTLGLPTSTTVSLVFNLLGAAFVIALIKMATGADTVGLGEMLNTAKATQVSSAIFVSVAIAFVFGLATMAITRGLFTFAFQKASRTKTALFAGVCSTAILYFLIIKGMKGMSFMTAETTAWIDANTWWLTLAAFGVLTALMFVLVALRVNVLKTVVLMGTFALAMAFAGNDLVNFIGVPLTGLASYNDFMAAGGGDSQAFMMDSLRAPASTPMLFLILAGVIMVVALAKSAKARNVSETEISLGSTNDADTKFKSSRLGRGIVALSLGIIGLGNKYMPAKTRTWLGKRFDTSQSQMEQGASFDLLRGSVNLVLAGVLIALGTSLKLPLSTTFVTFMVAMGTSLADCAWSRESAAGRVTGIIRVISGWLLTAVAAFLGAGILVAVMFFGGIWMMMAMAAGTIWLLHHSNKRFKEKQAGIVRVPKGFKGRLANSLASISEAAAALLPQMAIEQPKDIWTPEPKIKPSASVSETISHGQIIWGGKAYSASQLK